MNIFAKADPFLICQFVIALINFPKFYCTVQNIEENELFELISMENTLEITLVYCTIVNLKMHRLFLKTTEKSKQNPQCLGAQFLS